MRWFVASGNVRGRTGGACGRAAGGIDQSKRLRQPGNALIGDGALGQVLYVWAVCMHATGGLALHSAAQFLKAGGFAHKKRSFDAQLTMEKSIGRELMNAKNLTSVACFFYDGSLGMPSTCPKDTLSISG